MQMISLEEYKKALGSLAQKLSEEEIDQIVIVQADFEYYVTAARPGKVDLSWPATAPQMNQTIVISE